MFRKVVISLAMLASATAALASDFQTVNRSRLTIDELYLSPASQSEWGPDQLGDATLEPGATYTLRGVPDGSYDIRVVISGGRSCEGRNIPLQGGSVLTLTDQMLAACE